MGILLVDATQEDEYRLLPGAWDKISAAMLERYRRQARWSPLYIELGIPRALLAVRGIRPAPWVLQSKYLKARASELGQIRVSADQARAAGSMGDKPLLVLTAGRMSDQALGGGLSTRDLEEFQRTWVSDLQIRLAHLSSSRRRIMVADSGHDIAAERPEAIVSAARWLCEVIRRQ